MPDPAGELWAFSLAFYARPAVADALIALQDRCGLDVNLLLFALWHGLTGRGRLDAGAIAAADRGIAPLREAVIKPLRALRRRLKSDPAADVQQLRSRIKALELEAEKSAQCRLAALGAAVRTCSADVRLADALANLAACAGPQPETAILRQAITAAARQ